MKTLKDEVATVLSTIQYDSEVILTNLDVLGHSSQAKEFSRIYREYLLNKLKLTRETLLSVKSTDELSELIKVVEADYTALFDTLNAQINRVKDYEDISDYLFQLKQETKDLSPCLLDRLKSFVKGKD